MNNMLPLILGLILGVQVMSGQQIAKAVYFNIGDQELAIPARKVLFAKKLIAYNVDAFDSVSYQIKKKIVEGQITTDSCTYSPNYILLKNRDYAIFRFRRNSIKDVNGADIYIFAEEWLGSATVSLSENAQTWINVGRVNENNRFLNLSGKIPFGNRFTFLKIELKNENLSPDSSRLQLHQIAVVKSNEGHLGIHTKIVNSTIHTQSDKVKLQIKDYHQFDGDVITVKVNGQIISKRKLLTKWSRFVELPLRPGENKIIVKAKTEGWIKPNTIDIKIVDGIVINFGTYRIRKNRTKTVTIIRD